MDKICLKYFRTFLKEKISDLLSSTSFQFDAKKGFSWNILFDDLDDSDCGVIKAFAKEIAESLKETNAYRVHKTAISDLAATTFEFLPLPAPNVNILLENSILRYECIVFYYKNGILISLCQAALSERGISICGINISNVERKLLQYTRNLTARALLERPIYFDRTINFSQNIRENTCFAISPNPDAVSSAVSALPFPIFLGILTSCLASIMPYLDESAKPFFFPSLVLAENVKVAQMQYDSLRRCLGGFSFARDETVDSTLLAEVTLQDLSGIETLQRVAGLPVLVKITKDDIQRRMTEDIQRAHCSIISSGFATHPLKTVPLLVGKYLPADNAVFCLEWDSFEFTNPSDVAVIRQACEVLFRRPHALAGEVNRKISHLRLDGMRYCDAYLLAFAEVIDHCGGALIAKTRDMLSALHDQESERQRRFAVAADILSNCCMYEDVIAPSAQQMTDDHLGFCYTGKDSVPKIAFELKNDFPNFIQRKLGLRPADSEPFRQYLRSRGLLSELSRNVRGRTGASVSHVLVTNNSGCAMAKNPPHIEIFEQIDEF